MNQYTILISIELLPSNKLILIKLINVVAILLVIRKIFDKQNLSYLKAYAILQSITLLSHLSLTVKSCNACMCK